MSHFCVYVFHDENTDVDDLLSPYDDNLELDEPIVAFTKEQAIEHARNLILWQKEDYDEYLKDPEEFGKKWNSSAVDYFKNEYPKRLAWTDEQCYEYLKQDYVGGEVYEDGFVRPSMVAENGDLLTTRNPKGKWDWYEIGGRWYGQIFNDGTSKDEHKLSDIDDLSKVSTPFAFITTDGKWMEKGKMGWFGISDDDKSNEDWDKEFQDYLRSLDKDIILTQVDCHF